MKDRLGGILIKGLLGNPILARFNLFFDITIIDLTPTPSVTQTQYPTPTPLPSGHHGGGGGGGGHHPDYVDKQSPRTVQITIAYKGKKHTSIHQFNNNTLRISINILKGITYVKEKAYAVYVTLRKTVNNIKVKINGN